MGVGFKKYSIKIGMIIGILASGLIITPMLIVIIDYLMNGEINKYIPNIFKLISLNLNEYKFTLNEYLILTVYFIQIIATTYFSYLLYQNSQKSNEIAEELKEREYKKEKVQLKENTLIIYYDLKRGLKNLKKLYEGKRKISSDILPKRLYFSDEWIKNVASLKEYLSNEEIYRIYYMYERLHSLKELLEDNSESIGIEIEEFSKEIFDNIYLEYAHLKIETYDIESILSIEYQELFDKLKYILYVEINTEIKKREENDGMEIYEDSGKLFMINESNKIDMTGNLKIYSELGPIRYCGYFMGGKLKCGKRYEYYYDIYKEVDSNKNSVIEYEGREYKAVDISIKGKRVLKGFFKDGKFTGYKVVFDKNNKLKYKGYLVDDKYEGEGIEFYRGSSKFKGVFKEGKPFEGELYNKCIYNSTEEKINEILVKVKKNKKDKKKINRSVVRVYLDIKIKKGEKSIIKGTEKGVMTP